MPITFLLTHLVSYFTFDAFKEQVHLTTLLTNKNKQKNETKQSSSSPVGRWVDYNPAHWWGINPLSYVDQIAPPKVRKGKLLKVWIPKNNNPPQRDSKWMKVTWLKWPLHINVASIINNFRRASIFSGRRWSTLCTRDSQLSWRRELWVSPHSCGTMCRAPRALPLQERWNWLLSPIKRVEAVAALCKVTDNNPPLLHHHHHLSIVFASVLVWEPWFPEQRFGSHSKWWQRQWWDRTQNPRGGSRFRQTRGLPSISTAQRKLSGNGAIVQGENEKQTNGATKKKSPPNKRLLSYLFDICKLLNFIYLFIFLRTFHCQFQRRSLEI